MSLEFLDPYWWADSPVGLGHFYAALLALVIGPVSFLRRKGDRLHRVLGYAYVSVMAVVNVSALTMYDLTGGPNLFHFFAALSLATITPGVICAIRARRTGRRELLIAHYYFMSWSYFGLLAAFLSQLGTQLGPRLDGLPGGLSTFAWVGIATFLMAGAANVLINRKAKPFIRRFAPKPAAGGPAASTEARPRR